MLDYQPPLTIRMSTGAANDRRWRPPHGCVGYGSGAPGRLLAELNACTPASLSPSNGVIGPPPLPKQMSSSAGSANHMPTWLRSTRTRLPLTSVEANASSTIRWNSACALPYLSVSTSPKYSAAPNGEPGTSNRNVVKEVFGFSQLASTLNTSRPVS